MRRFAGIASSLFAIASCGKTETFTDAAPPTDAPSVDAAVPSGSITVTTHSRCCTDPPGTLVAGVQVIAIQPDGTVADSGATDANGEITLTGVQEGAGVTAIYTTATNTYKLVSVLAVKPGDHLILGDDYSLPITGTDGQMTINVPPVANAYAYYAYTPCGAYAAVAGPTTITVNQYGYCQPPTVANMLMIAYDGSYNVLATATIPNADFSNNAVVNLASWTAGPGNNLDVSVAGLDPAVTQTYLGANAIFEGSTQWGNSMYVIPTGGSASTSMTLPGGASRIYTYVQMNRDGQLGDQETYGYLPPTGTSQSFTAPHMPWLGQVIVNGAAKLATWIQLGTEGNDGAYADISWSHYDIATDTTSYYDWALIAPPGITSWSWADPPAALAQYVPNDIDNVSGNIQLVDLSTADGYDGLRGANEWDISCPQCEAQNGELVGTASVAYTFGGGEGFAGRHPHPSVAKHQR